jgi:uncharacterized membrane protein
LALTLIIVFFFWRLAGAIALQTLAFVVWNIGTRTPWTMLNDVRRGAREPRALLGGNIALLVGAIFMAAATVLLFPVVAPDIDLVPVEICTLIVALAVEMLIGNDLRRLLRR